MDINDWVVLDQSLIDTMSEDYSIDPLEIVFDEKKISYWKIVYDAAKNLFLNYGFKTVGYTIKQLQLASKPFTIGLKSFFGSDDVDEYEIGDEGD
jgi:hypothetical protein